jgi:hypothetical protein
VVFHCLLHFLRSSSTHLECYFRLFSFLLLFIIIQLLLCTFVFYLPYLGFSYASHLSLSLDLGNDRKTANAFCAFDTHFFALDLFFHLHSPMIVSSLAVSTAFSSISCFVSFFVCLFVFVRLFVCYSSLVCHNLPMYNSIRRRLFLFLCHFSKSKTIYTSIRYYADQRLNLNENK